MDIDRRLFIRFQILAVLNPGSYLLSLPIPLAVFFTLLYPRETVIIVKITLMVHVSYFI